MSPYRLTLLSTLSLMPILSNAQSCAGTTYEDNCCVGTLYGSSVAMMPSEVFPMGTPPGDFTPTNDFALPLPTEAQILTREDTPSAGESLLDDAPVTDPAALASLSRELESLVSAAATDTAVYSILPFPGPAGNSEGDDGAEETSGGLWDPNQNPHESTTGISLADGVTCGGQVVPITAMMSIMPGPVSQSETQAPSETVTETETQATATQETSGETEANPSPTDAATTSDAAVSEAGAAAITGGLGALLGVGLGVVAGAL